MRVLVYVTLALSFLVPTVADSRLHTPSEAREPVETQEPAPTPAQKKEQTKEAPGTFRPSEKVPADSAISFPVDI